MTRIVLLGDSIFDNAAYVAGGPDVVQQLRAVLPPDCRASLLAADGSVTEGVQRQLQRVPADATHLAVSVGGNDALRSVSVLNQPLNSTTEALTRMADVRDVFEAHYRAMIEAALRLGRPTFVCTIYDLRSTIYDPRFPDLKQRRYASAGLAIFNDVITREVSRHGLPMIDLRLIANEDSDFATPIEPSVMGGREVAGAIAKHIDASDPVGRRSSRS